MELVYLVAAALCFAVGGAFMKVSIRASRVGPTMAFLALFIVGVLVSGHGAGVDCGGVVWLRSGG
jgi:hypothetical protein